MLIHVWLALFAAGVATSAAAFYFKKAALYASLLNLFVWLVVAVASLNVEVTTAAGEIVTFNETSVAGLAAVNAIVSLPVAYLAAVGEWGDDDADDGMGAATAGLRPDDGHPGLDDPDEAGQFEHNDADDWRL